MGLLDGLEMPKKVYPCRVRTVATEELDKDDAEVFMVAVMNPEWQYKPLADALRERGIICSQPAIKAHRMGVCSCSKI